MSSFINTSIAEYRNINKYTIVSMLHAKRGDNLIGDMSIRIIDINITGKTVSADTIL